jgi:hypothetical protein
MNFYIKFDDKYYTDEKFGKWKSDGFEINPFYFKGNKIHKMKLMNFLDKKRNKGRMLKIKLLYNETISNIDNTEDISEIFLLKKDIIIFVTGGGFVSDFEKIAQFYLREISNDLSLPIFIIKYR